MENQNPLHLDANEVAFFDNALTQVKARTYDVQRKELKALALLPVSTENDPGAERIEYRSYDQVGMAKIVADYANDFPRVDVFGSKKSADVFSIGDSYGYSIQEIRRAQKAGTALDSKRAEAARRAIDEKQDSIAWKGDDAANLPGFIDAGGVEATITGSWASATVSQILGDIKSILTAAPVATNGKEMPDTLIMPMDAYNILAYTPMSVDNPKTILTFIRENYPNLTRIEWVQELKGAGANGADRVMAYSRDPLKVEVQIPLRLEMLPPQQHGMEFDVICHQRTAGTIVYYPMSVAFADGV